VRCGYFFEMVVCGEKFFLVGFSYKKISPKSPIKKWSDFKSVRLRKRSGTCKDRRSADKALRLVVGAIIREESNIAVGDVLR
jgi:hypothetical protein